MEHKSVSPYFKGETDSALPVRNLSVYIVALFSCANVRSLVTGRMIMDNDDIKVGEEHNIPAVSDETNRDEEKSVDGIAFAVSVPATQSQNRENMKLTSDAPENLRGAAAADAGVEEEDKFTQNDQAGFNAEYVKQLSGMEQPTDEPTVADTPTATEVSSAAAENLSSTATEVKA